MLRCMVRNGHARVNSPPVEDEETSLSENEESDNSEYDWRYIITNQSLHQITKTDQSTNTLGNSRKTI